MKLPLNQGIITNWAEALNNCKLCQNRFIRRISPKHSNSSVIGRKKSEQFRYERKTKPLLTADPSGLAGLV